jgi:hypothetical protein
MLPACWRSYESQVFHHAAGFNPRYLDLVAGLNPRHPNGARIDG